MIRIEFPTHSFKIKTEGEKEIIFDECRKSWVHLSPEEWVRQNFIQYLVQNKGCPASLIAIEREISLADIKRRFDIVVFKNAKPWMVVECKEMNVALTETVIKQVLNYNRALQVEFIVITNGTSTFALQLQGNKHEWINELPFF